MLDDGGARDRGAGDRAAQRGDRVGELLRGQRLLGRLVADVEALDGLYLRALVPAAASIAVVAAIALILVRVTRCDTTRAGQ